MNDCLNEAVNALLAEFGPVAEENGVRLTVDMDMLPVTPLEDDILVAVFRTALEQALAACGKLPEGREKYIKVYMRSFPMWCVSISNPCEKKIALDGDGYPLNAHGERGGHTAFLADTLKARKMCVDYETGEGVFEFRFFYTPGARK